MNNQGVNVPGEAPQPIPNLAPGIHVGAGRFLLKKILGQGGMGVVWLAHDLRLREFTALKFLPPEVASDSPAVEDLRKETLRSRKLSHPNIVRIHDFWEADGEPTFVSMEYVDGPNLHYLRAGRPSQVLPWKFLMPLLRQLCEALEYAHGERVLHRDLKPANLMLDANGRLKLADFGLACVIHDSTTSSSSHAHTPGTFSYMSPQQADGEKPTITDDIYSFGATIYELMTSQPPFSTGDIGYQLRHNRPQFMFERLADLELNNDIPSEVSAMVMACLAKEPEKRPQTARAILDWLDSTNFSKPNAPSFVPEVVSNPVAAVGPITESPDPSNPFPAPAMAKPGNSSRIGKWPFVSAIVILPVLIGTFLYLRGMKFSPSTGISDPALAHAAPSEEGFVSLFNGQDLTGWTGDERFWSVKDEAITGQFTRKTGLNQATFLVWEGGNVDDFELRLSFRGQGNGGVKYRSMSDKDGDLAGYIAPLWKRRAGDLAFTGSALPMRDIARGNGNEVLRFGGDWNEYVIIARGRQLIHKINGTTIIEKTDADSARFSSSGKLALELVGGPKETAYALQFKNIRLKRLASASTATAVPP